MKRIFSILISIVICAGAMVSCDSDDKGINSENNDLSSIRNKLNTEERDKENSAEKTELSSVRNKSYTEEQDKELLEDVNRDAKTIFVEVNGICSDLVADGKVKLIINGDIYIKPDEPGNSYFYQQIIQGLKYWDINGEVFLRINNGSPELVQLRYKKNGNVGQYPVPDPNSPAEIMFEKGDFPNDAPNSTESSENSSLSDEQDMTELEEKNKDAKRAYYLARRLCSEMCESFQDGQLIIRKQIINTDDPGDDPFNRELSETLKKWDINGDVYIETSGNYVNFIQLRNTRDGSVTQFPNSCKDPNKLITFGEYHTNVTTTTTAAPVVIPE